MRRLFVLSLVAFAFLGLGSTSQAEDLKIEARLIWGTNEEKPSSSKLDPVDDTTVQKLTNVFKWKKYFEVTNLTEVIPSRTTKRIRMSDACDVEITELEGAKVEVKLFGHGKQVNKTVEVLRKGTYFTLGGPSKNGTAWFVVVTQL